MGFQDSKSAGCSRIKETIDTVPIPEVPYYLPAEVKNISCLHSKAMGVYRTVYSQHIRDQLRQDDIRLSQAVSFAQLGQKSILQEVVEAVLHQAAVIPPSGCLGMQSLVAVRLYLSTVLNWLSTVTLGTLAAKLFPGPQISNSGVGAGYQCMLLEML